MAEISVRKNACNFGSNFGSKKPLHTWIEKMAAFLIGKIAAFLNQKTGCIVDRKIAFDKVCYSLF
jgi:hypothetical protein